MPEKLWTPDYVGGKVVWLNTNDNDSIFFNEDGTIYSMKDRVGNVFSGNDNYANVYRTITGSFLGKRIVTSQAGTYNRIHFILRKTFDALRGQTGITFAFIFRQISAAQGINPVFSIQLENSLTVSDSIISLHREDAAGINARLGIRGLKSRIEDATQPLRYITIQNLGATDWGIVSGTIDHASGIAKIHYGNYISSNLAIPIGSFKGMGFVHPIYIGGLRSDYFFNQNMEFGEFLAFDHADDSLLARVEGYMAWNWGIQSTLPDSHEFKDAAPTIAVNDESVLFGKQLRRVFHDLICKLTNIPNNLVRPSFQLDSPRIDPNQNWASFSIDSFDKSYSGFGESGDNFTFTRWEDFELLVSFYGENAEDNANIFADGIEIESNRFNLVDNKIMLKEIGSVLVVPELINEKYIQRVDVNFTFSREMKRNYNVGSIGSIHGSIKTDNGLEEPFNVED